MKAGAHVFVEKPIATTVEDAQRVVDTAIETDRKLVVGYILRLWCMDLRISISGSASVFESLSCLSSSTHRVATISPEPSTGS